MKVLVIQLLLGWYLSIFKKILKYFWCIHTHHCIEQKQTVKQYLQKMGAKI